MSVFESQQVDWLTDNGEGIKSFFVSLVVFLCAFTGHHQTPGRGSTYTPVTLLWCLCVLGSCETHIPVPYIEEPVFYFPGRLYWLCLSTPTCFCLDNIGWGSWVVGESVGVHWLLVSSWRTQRRGGTAVGMSGYGAVVLCAHPIIGRSGAYGTVCTPMGR